MFKPNNLFKIPAQLFIVLYAIVAIIIYSVLLIFLFKILPDIDWLNEMQKIFVYIFSSFVYIVCMLIIGSYLYVLFSIPIKLAKEFDVIKNDIASRRIKTSEEFSINLLKFINSFFDYTFFDIEYSFIQLKDKKIQYSFDLVDEYLNKNNLEFINKTALEKEEVFFVDKFKIDQVNWRLYVIPINFEEEYYGHIGVFSKSKLNRIYRQILNDFENNFIDDQLVNVINL